MPQSHSEETLRWPTLPLDQWKDTYATLHMWTQIVGKVRLALTPMTNHWWNVAFRVSPRGLTTTTIPYGERTFEITFDFIAHELVLLTSDGRRFSMPLVAQSVADFYQSFTRLLRAASIDVHLWRMPVEIPDPIPFDQDKIHSSYDPEYAHRFWEVLVSVNCVFEEFRAGFLGKSSPVHFFWGSFDLAVTRFSGRRAPERPGADRITKEAYSHEVSSAGFWPGSGKVTGPAFYSYASPEPKGFKEFPVKPAEAHYDNELNEFILMYDDVRKSALPRRALLDFCQSTYEAAASQAKWDRIELERHPANGLSEVA
jgi:hypothetical protein